MVQDVRGEASNTQLALLRGSLLGSVQRHVFFVLGACSGAFFQKRIDLLLHFSAQSHHIVPVEADHTMQVFGSDNPSQAGKFPEESQGSALR